MDLVLACKSKLKPRNGLGFLIEVCIYNKAQKRRERKKRIKKREKIPSWRRKLKLVLHDLVGKNASERE